MGRHGGRGGHRHGGFFGRHGRGGGGDFRMGRKLGAGDLQLLLLRLLQENPRHGYELIKDLEQRTSGFYSPSPGVIYPALTYLEEIGFASVEAEGNKKLYRITETGAAFLTENQAAAEAMLNELVEIGHRFARAQKAMSEEDSAASDADDESELGTWPLGERRFGRGRRRHEIVELLQARHDLKRALVETMGASPEDHKRIADILRRAAAEIRGQKS
ncbi:MAG TPA: PadR family transcriptional regulator [Dongiaceae bacterium]|jgi:DNA-binding PadR family transcriptional regulator|nr:PadR family transcriptional regulator [Dongiaceae bacterium]